jgi:methionyl-tRNA formyltransferase
MTKIRTIIVTHDEPLFLRDALEGIFTNCLDLDLVCIIKGPPPRMINGNSILERGKSVLKNFGMPAFVFYSFKLINAQVWSCFRSKPNYSKCNVKRVKSVNSDESISLITALKPDLILSVLAGEIFRNDVIKIAPLGILNVHTGQLPKYKGLMPTFWALKNNELVIGISTFLVNEIIDGGKILGYHEIKTLNSSHFNLMERVYRELWVSIDVAVKNITNTEQVIFREFLPEQYFSAPSKVDVDEFIAEGGRLF